MFAWIHTNLPSHTHKYQSHKYACFSSIKFHELHPEEICQISFVQICAKL